MNIIRVIFINMVLCSALFSNISCAMNDYGEEADPISCDNTNVLIGRLNNFTTTVDLVIKETDPQGIDILIEKAKSLIACSSKLTEMELLGRSDTERDKCDPFPITITLSGIEAGLKEIQECMNARCDNDVLSLKRDVVTAQNKRLIDLIDSCKDI